MKQHKLFRQTRWQLTTWYAGVIGAILTICGLGFYEAIAHAHRITIDRELESVAGTLHDSLKPILQEPGRLNPKVNNLLSNVCSIEINCEENRFTSPYRLGILEQENYYLSLLDIEQKLVAIGGKLPPEARDNSNDIELITFKTSNGIRYRQITLKLHTQNNQEWGYLQMGRSLQDFDKYVANVKLIIIFGLPLVIILVMISGWWLAQRAMEPIHQSYQQIQQFTADAAHELRTPLAAIRATVESTLMLPSISNEETIETLQTVNRQNKRLARLVSDLLILSRMDLQLNSENTSGDNQGKVNLQDLVSDVEEELAALALANHIYFTKEVRTLEPLEINGNQEQLYRLVTNLVINAIQYTPAQGKVKLILEQENQFALIRVKDTGIGIDKIEQKQIFDRFYRVDKARSFHGNGSGLGLSIALAIAKAHQGDIQIISELGKGSVFIVMLSL